MPDDNAPGPLIGPAELAEQLAQPRPPTLLDVRWSLTGPPGREAYLDGHLLTAQFVDLDTDLADPPGPRGRHPLPDPGRFAAAMRRAGVRSDVPVVVYDQADATSAARAWWLLSHHGHPDVRVLDAGYDGWVAAGGITTSLVGSVPEGDFEPAPGRLPVLDADAAARLARDGVLLDARAPERFRGETEPVDPVAGHIPGAVSAPSAANTDAGRWLPVDELRERFAALGVPPDGEVGAYCGSGVTAAHTVLALRVAGVERPALYPGSWSEWVTDPDRPVVTGE